MQITSQTEYFYHDWLRWSFGFQNPNKAAVIFACLFPLLFAIWNMAWSIKGRTWKTITLTASALSLLGDGLCLGRTYSRGGIVAAAAAMAYLLFSTAWAHRRHRRFKLTAHACANCVLAGLLLILFVGLGLEQRSLQSVTNHDASVDNRLVLWQTALQMAVENPRGFGSGKSGEAYMQWYQPIDASTAYRTMVNSYLTFLVEEGWIWSALALAGLALFWRWAKPATNDTCGFAVAHALRASILAFLVSGVFSTVMEEPLLWIIPGACVLALMIWSWNARVPLDRPKIAWAVALPSLVLAGLCLGGWHESHADSLSREFKSDGHGIMVSKLGLKHSSHLQKTWVVIPDPKILGPCYGKLLRQLAAEAGVALELRTPTQLRGDIDRVLITGSAVESSAVSSHSATVLLAPATITAISAQEWLASSPHLTLLVSSIDQDRRSRFWRHCVPAPASSHLTITTLDGVGLRVDWDWEQVIDVIRKS